MSTFLVSVIFAILVQKHCVNAFTQSITLHPSGLKSTDGSISINTENSVTTVNDTWHMNPNHQTGTDMTINLDNEWTFHPSIESTINITIDGFTPNITLLDGEFLILFSVGDTQFFSLIIILQKLHIKQSWRSYPSDHNESLATTNSVYNDIINKQSPIRYCRISNNDSWEHIGSNYYKNGLIWPLNIQITNDPINNKVYYKCYLNDKTLAITYNTSFNTNTPMAMYIMNDASDNKPFDIYSIDVSYGYDIDTPTLTPTTVPTHIPSNNPTIEPTENPTHMPTGNEGQYIDFITTLVTNKHLVSADQKSTDLMTHLIIGQLIFICLLCCICGMVMKIAINKFRCKKASKPKLVTLPSQSGIHSQLENAIIHSNVELVQLDIVEENKQDSMSSHMYSAVAISTEDQIPTRNYSDEEQMTEDEVNKLVNPTL